MEKIIKTDDNGNRTVSVADLNTSTTVGANAMIDGFSKKLRQQKTLSDEDKVLIDGRCTVSCRQCKRRCLSQWFRNLN